MPFFQEMPYHEYMATKAKRASKESAGSATPIQGKTKLSENGRIVIPAAMREALGFKPGETLVMDVHEGTLRIETYWSRVKRIQAQIAEWIPEGVSLADELIAERRREAQKEQEEWDRERHEAGRNMRRAG
jgi:AbrB family looped-hinge helix DNA binding protein